MYEGCITDVEGIIAGHYTDKEGQTGCTAIICEEGAVCGVDVRGSAPGTRETDLARTGNAVTHAHAVVLSGGSAYGLEAACGVMQYLEEKGVGFDTPYAKVPIVLSAVIYDLGTGRGSIRPDKKAGYMAAEAAVCNTLPQGKYGAGTGATVGKLLGMQNAMDGGFGCASIHLAGGVVVAAAFAVNAMGDIYDADTGRMVAGLTDGNGNFLNTVKMLINSSPETQAMAGQNTTIGVVATNAVLTKEEANKLASIAHDGIALAVRPSHTMADGDTVFALATGKKKAELTVLLAAATEAAARAIANACTVKGA